MLLQCTAAVKAFGSCFNLANLKQSKHKICSSFPFFFSGPAYLSIKQQKATKILLGWLFCHSYLSKTASEIYQFHNLLAQGQCLLVVHVTFSAWVGTSKPCYVATCPKISKIFCSILQQRHCSVDIPRVHNRLHITCVTSSGALVSTMSIFTDN